jgi:hypothetical protein
VAEGRRVRFSARPGSGENAEQAVAADGAGVTAFRGMEPLQPAPLLNLSFGSPPGRGQRGRKRFDGAAAGGYAAQANGVERCAA